MGTAITLFIIGVSLILLNFRAIVKEKNSFQGMLNRAEVDMEEVEVEIGKLRKEFAETLLEIQTQIVNLEKGIINNKNHTKDRLDEVHIKNYKDSINYNDIINDIVDIDFNKIKSLKQETNDEDIIIEELDKNETVQESENKESGNNSIRIKEVERLLDQDFSIEEISNMLKIGKGEILLIKELYLK
ncbi:hypothetical protein GOM49_08360 [Clostridium bovifaecis]|uniref:Uncharacterized protein n=1 Tax=Clostridium bovifaecis TaxID=2184719 RepID=A0A6I6EXU3_9CLOT|nr:hypothetical protein GOM49_08360 [Clostridium bovifaecis]